MFVLTIKLEEAGLIRFKRERIDLFTRLGVNLFVKGLKGDVQHVRSSNHEVMVTESTQEQENRESQLEKSERANVEALNTIGQSEKSERANVELLNKIGQSMILQENENDESRSENSELNSDKSDTYDLRHTGMCENCHYMGLVGTLCANCEELQHVLKKIRGNRVKGTHGSALREEIHYGGQSELNDNKWSRIMR
jgi:hypothetical protein